jgi:HSP20 family molecular chaperone IbpA
MANCAVFLRLQQRCVVLRHGPRFKNTERNTKMTIRDLIPWNRGRDMTERRGEFSSPFMTLHREMNRLFDEAFRGFDLAPFGSNRGSNDLWSGAWNGWPNIELSESENAFKVTAELPGLDEKEVDVQLNNGILVIKGEKKPKRRTRTACLASVISAGSSGAFRLRTWRRTR